MPHADAPGPAPNDDQVRYWNEVAGPRWVRFQERLDRELAELGALAMERGGVAAGESVLDVGCGCGGTTLELARRVGPRGRALGVDVSRPMLERARARAGGVANVSFLEADAQSAAFEAAPFDLVFSRFGVMFFSDPAAAFANLRRALRPGGRLSFVCWQRLADNPWVAVPLGALATQLPLPPPPPPGAPGPFAFADAERVAGLLGAAGFAGVVRDDVRETLRLGGGDLDAAVDFALEIGPASAALREADAGPELRARVAAAVRDALAPFAAGGAVRLPSAAWRFGARNPG
jgi:SAM-dependent methyltransferase